MSFYFIANNLHFALELLGALAFFVMSWLAIDAYLVNKHSSSMIRAWGLGFVGIWQVIHAFSLTGDLINFAGFSIYILGLVFVLVSFMSLPELASLSAIILIPSFGSSVSILELIALCLLGTIAFFIYGQMKREFNNTLRPLALGFLFLAISAGIQFFVGPRGADSILWYVSHAIKSVAFLSFAFWGWQYLRLRVQESLVLIFITMTLFIATIVTLAFSTILIYKIEQQTRNSLIIDAKVFDLSVQGLSKQASSESRMISSDKDVVDSVGSEDLLKLQSTLSKYLETEKLGFVLVTDKSGVVLMRAHSPGERGDSVAKERAVEEALIGNYFSTIEFSPSEKFSVRSGAPIYKEGRVVGAVIAGFPLDNAMVDGIKKITGLDTTLYENDKSVATTALASNGRNRLTGITMNDSDIKGKVLSEGGIATARVVLKDTPFLASYIPIKNGDGQIVGMFSAAKPQADILDIANSTNRLTLITVTVLLLLLSFPMFILTRRILEGI